jgi:hypothetical protein
MKKTIAALTALALTAAACGGGDDEKETTDSAPVATAEAPETTTTTVAPETTTTESTTTTTLVPADDSIRQPLTGEIVESEDDLITHPAVIVKIDNNDARARRNHSGLAVADIVFEEIVEGDTRFAAVFHSQGSDPVGPIRSGREQDVNMLSSMNAPLFAWSGGNPGVTRLIAASFLTDLNAQRNSGSYFRGPGSSPHNLYSTTDRLLELTPDDHPGAPAQQFTYVLPDEDFVGEAVEAFDLNMDGKRVRWEWDDTEEAFARFQSGSRHVDVLHGDIFATNIVVMVVDYKPSTIDANSPDAQTLGSGPAYVFSNGQVVTGRWQRDLAVGAILLTDDDGEPIGLTPGNTWVEIAENDGGDAFTLPPVPFPTEDAPAPTTVDPATIPRIALDDPDSAPTNIDITFPGE